MQMRALVRKGVFFECQYFFSLYDRLKVQSTLTVKKPGIIPTINLEEFNRLCDNSCTSTSTPVHQQYSAETKCDELAPVSDDFIKTFVTPKKVKKVREGS